MNPTEAVKAEGDSVIVGDTAGRGGFCKTSGTTLGKMEKHGLKGCWAWGNTARPKITAGLGLRFVLRVKEGENIPDFPVSGSGAAIKWGKWCFLAFPSKEGAPAV